MKRLTVLLFALVLCLPLLNVSCGGKRPDVRPSLPPPATTQPGTAPTAAPAPTIEIDASPTSIERGQQTTLTWKAQNADSVIIDSGVGNVSETGSVVLTPRESTTFTATAKGAGGEVRASTRVTVVAPREVGGITSSDIQSLQQAINDGRVKDIFFDYDKADLSAESRAILETNARWFRQYPGAKLVIEGHCDERGTEEYNLALGDRRAQATREYLIELGVSQDQLESISLGEEQPFSPGHDEESYAQNRRAHFAVK